MSILHSDLVIGMIHGGVSLASFGMYRYNSQLPEWKKYIITNNYWLISGYGNGVVAMINFLIYFKMKK